MRTLPSDLAGSVARWLVAAAEEPDPDTAYQYAIQARQLAARVGVVRESCGITAYRAGKWAEALAEFRAARRLTGRDIYLPMMADAERGLGRPDRALAIIHDPGARRLDRQTQIELLIVESGIRRDEGRPAAAVVVLQVPELTDGRLRPWSARLFYAYADALLDVEREEEAQEWFGRAMAADAEGETDADERFDGLDSVIIEDLWEDEADGTGDPDGADDPDDGEPDRAGEPDGADEGVPDGASNADGADDLGGAGHLDSTDDAEADGTGGVRHADGAGDADGADDSELDGTSDADGAGGAGHADGDALADGPDDIDPDGAGDADGADDEAP